MEIPEKEYIVEHINALRREVTLARESHEREHTSHNLAHEREHSQATEAIKKAEDGMHSRFASVNEFRAQLSDQAARFVTRDLVDERLAAILGRIELIERRMEQIAGRERGQAAAINMAVVAAGFLATVIAIVGGLAVLLR